MRRFILIGLASLALCGASRRTAIHHVSAGDAEKLLTEGGVFLLDVRTPKEFREGHIPSAVLIPLAELHKRMKELPRDRTQSVLVYCATGYRSAKAARALYRAGYKDVYHLRGGLRAWTAAQKPIQVPLPSLDDLDGKASSTP